MEEHLELSCQPIRVIECLSNKYCLPHHLETKYFNLISFYPAGKGNAKTRFMQEKWQALTKEEQRIIAALMHFGRKLKPNKKDINRELARIICTRITGCFPFHIQLNVNYLSEHFDEISAEKHEEDTGLTS